MTYLPARTTPAFLPIVSAILLLVALVPIPSAAQAPPLEVQRLAGGSRIETAVAVSTTAFPSGAPAVVLARADAYADALAGAPLAAALGGPVLLTNTSSLPGAVIDELARLRPDRVVLVGDLSATVAGQVLDAGSDDVDRLRGADQWETGALVAQATAELTSGRHVVVIEGANEDPSRGWPDALAASAWAAGEGMPILMTTADRLPPATAAMITALGAVTVTVVGGEAAVSEGVAAELASLVEGEVHRLAGGSRYDTALAVARQTLDEQGYTSSLWVASGGSWPDALVAGPAIAALGGTLVLADPVTMRRSRQTADFIDTQRGFAGTARLIGGLAVLSDAVEATVQTGEIEPSDDGGSPARPPEGGAEDAGGDGDATGGGATGEGLPALPPALQPANPSPALAGAVPWSDPATWGGTMPVAGDTVTIPADQAVLLDVQPPPLRGIRVDGLLTVADVDMTIAVDWIEVNGRLAIGTEHAPLTADVDVVISPREGDEIAGAGMGPIAVRGGTLDIHGTGPAKTWTRLTETAGAGSTALRVEDATGWSAGDQIVVAATGLDPDQAEERTITSVEGTTLRFSRPLEHGHWGQAEQLGGTEVAQRAEVGNLSRNVVVRTAESHLPSRLGGHVMAFSGSVVRIGGAEFVGLGQAGELARYPIHFHMMGSAAGSWVRGASIHHSFQRCLTIHGTDHVEVRDTIGYETFGHCFFFEDGVERENQLICNLGLSTRRPLDGQVLISSDEEPATFWVTNPSNHLVDNAAAGGFGHGFWYDLPKAPTGLSDTVEMDIRELPFGTFRDNVAHSTASEGWKQGIGLFVEDYHPPAPAIFERFTGYANEGFGVWAEGVELHDAVLAGNTIGFLGLESALRDSTVVGATANDEDQTWRLTGVGFYHDRSEITDTTFVNFGERPRHWQRPGKALEFIAERRNDASVVSGATFVNADRLRITQPPDEGEPDLRTAAILDADGTISGAPALLTSAMPLLTADGCVWREDLGANACPAGLRRTWIKITDESERDLDGLFLTPTDGGGEQRLFMGDDHLAVGHSDLLAARTYQLRTGAPHSGHLELIMADREEAWVDIEIPWPHAEAHVYDGWGRWQSVDAADSLDGIPDVGFVHDRAAGVLRVRHTVDDVGEKGTWQRLELCAQAFCGQDGPG